MSSTTAECTLGTVLGELGSAASLIGNSGAWLDRKVSGAVIWLAADPLPVDTQQLIVCPEALIDVATVRALLDGAESRAVVVRAPTDQTIAEYILDRSRTHAIVVLEQGGTPADAISATERAAQSVDESVSRRLASLQRTLSRALADRSTIESLASRLKKLCNATIVLLDRNGDVLHATGPVPLSLLFGEISKTHSESQIIDIDGWHGVATRLEDFDEPDEHLGWLVATSRRQPFPDPYVISAVHMAATLVEVDRRMTTISRAQERAIRATVLEQILALRPIRDDPELAGRLAGLGVTFTGAARVVVLRPVRSARKARLADTLEQLAAATAATLAAASVSHLITVRDNTVTVLAQADTPEIAALLSRQSGPAKFQCGIGRRITVVADAADSYHDAQLAVQSLRRSGSQKTTMSYEDFDLATALFSDVGLDQMAARAEVYFAGIRDREALIDGLRAYFDHGQNIIAAAAELDIHHNSLRYRLSKIEEALGVHLKDAGDISSVYLALTALELSGKLDARTARVTRRNSGHARAADIAASGTPTDYPGTEAGPGVVMDDS
jgi:sugar diacid utilization regulator